jgi:1,4-alpha-glucan branching enzyme
MNTTTSTNGIGDHLSARKMVKPVNFFLTAPTAHSVSIIGDFNDWNPAANPMRRRIDGAWFAQVELTHGHHEYQFLVDGITWTDPQAMGIGVNRRGEKVSLVAVS